MTQMTFVFAKSADEITREREIELAWEIECDRLSHAEDDWNYADDE